MKEYFEELALQWDLLHPPEEQGEAIGLGLGYLKQRWGPWEGKALVDMGCGTGVLLPHLLAGLGGGRLWAVDHAEGMVAVAKAKHADARLHFICEDALRWGLPQGDMDGVLCYNAFPHFPREEALQKVASWLRPGGFFLIWHGHGRKHINRIHREAGAAVAKDRLAPAKEVAALAAQHGFFEVAMLDDGQRWLLLLKKVLPLTKQSP
jgi:SAM-dependent methyltransferase